MNIASAVHTLRQVHTELTAAILENLDAPESPGTKRALAAVKEAIDAGVREDSAFPVLLERARAAVQSAHLVQVVARARVDARAEQNPPTRSGKKPARRGLR